MNGLRRVWLTAPVPCHPHRKVRLLTFPDVPRQAFERACPVCRAKWEIDVRLLKDRAGVFVHRLEWWCAKAYYGGQS